MLSVVFLNEVLPVTEEDLLSAQLSLLSLCLPKCGGAQGPVLVLITFFHSLICGFRCHFCISALQVFVFSPHVNRLFWKVEYIGFGFLFFTILYCCLLKMCVCMCITLHVHIGKLIYIIIINQEKM